MKVLSLFDTYFLLLIVIQGSIVAFYDAAVFKRKNMERARKKARTIGITVMVLALALFIARHFK